MVTMRSRSESGIPITLSGGSKCLLLFNTQHLQVEFQVKDSPYKLNKPNWFTSEKGTYLRGTFRYLS